MPEPSLSISGGRYKDRTCDTCCVKSGFPNQTHGVHPCREKIVCTTQVIDPINVRSVASRCSRFLRNRARVKLLHLGYATSARNGRPFAIRFERWLLSYKHEPVYTDSAHSLDVVGLGMAPRLFVKAKRRRSDEAAVPVNRPRVFPHDAHVGASCLRILFKSTRRGHAVLDTHDFGEGCGR